MGGGGVEGGGMRGQKSLWHVVHALHSAFMQFETQSNLHRSSWHVSMAGAASTSRLAVFTAAFAAFSMAAAASLGFAAFGMSHCTDR